MTKKSTNSARLFSYRRQGIRQGSQGQAILESILILPLLLIVVTYAVFQIYETTLRLVITQLLDKALICESSQPPNSHDAGPALNSYQNQSAGSDCESELKNKLKSFSGQITVQSYSNHGVPLSGGDRRMRWTGQIRISLPLKRTLSLERELLWSHWGPPL